MHLLRQVCSPRPGVGGYCSGEFVLMVPPQPALELNTQFIRAYVLCK